MENLEKLTDAFREMILKPRYKLEQKKIINNILEYHDKNGGVTKHQIRLLGEIYAKYQK
jgi:hypothetical protein